MCQLLSLLYFLFLWCTTIAAIWLRVVNASTSYGWQLNCRKSARLENIKCIGLQLLTRTRLVVLLFKVFEDRVFEQIRAVLALSTHILKDLVNLKADSVRKTKQTKLQVLSKDKSTDSIDLLAIGRSSFSPCVS